jgi:UDP-N-acetylmuramate dehydrogenase
VVPKEIYQELVRWFEYLPAHQNDEGMFKLSAAHLLEQFGWKGRRSDHVGCWDTQPLCLVHYGGGSTSELVEFANAIVRDVKEHTTITLEPEVRYVDVDMKIH